MCASEEYVFFYCWINVLDIFASFIWLIVVQIHCLLIDCLHDLFIVGSEVFKYPTIVLLLFISPFISVNICFVYFGAPKLDT